MRHELGGTESLLSTFPPSQNGDSGPTPHFITLAIINLLMCFAYLLDYIPFEIHHTSLTHY